MTVVKIPNLGYKNRPHHWVNINTANDMTEKWMCSYCFKHKDKITKQEKYCKVPFDREPKEY